VQLSSLVVDMLVDGGADDEEELVDVEVLEAKLPNELPEVGIPQAEIVKDVAEASVGHRANGYVVPETTVPAAARSLRQSALILPNAFKGQAPTVVVEAVVVTSHPIVVIVDVSQLVETDDVDSAILVIAVQVTYVSYPVVVLVQELDDEVDVVDSGLLVSDVELESSSSSSFSRFSVSDCTPSKASRTNSTAAESARFPTIPSSPFSILPRSLIRLPNSPPPPS
jgi:hypothetical protein